MVKAARPGERIPIASDHAGFELKERLRVTLADMGFEVEDIGTHSTASTDYPDYAHPLAEAVSSGEATRGVLLCGTGLGMSYVANRYPGVRAAVAWTPEIALLARKHNDANILTMGGRIVAKELGWEITRTFLATPFLKGKHLRRVNKIKRMEHDPDST